MLLNEDDLILLGINLREFQRENSEEKLRMVTRQFRQQCLKYHSDKTTDPLKIAQFPIIVEAYHRLRDELQQKPFNDLHEYFTFTPIIIPLTAFSFAMRQEINARYEELKGQIHDFETHEEKLKFVQKFEAFLTLAISIQKIQEALDKEQGGYLYAHQNCGLVSQITMELRKLILVTFGEEYLDDFQYRHALATGEIFPILTTRKLLSPLKWIMALANSLYIIGLRLLLYPYAYITMQMFMDFNTQYQAFYQNDLDATQVISLLSKMAALIIFTSIAIQLLISSSFFAYIIFNLPALNIIAEVAACPINKIIRPIAEFTGISFIWLDILLSAGALLIGYAAYSLLLTLTLATSIEILNICLVAFFIYQMYLMILISQKFYSLHPAAGIFIGITLGLSLITSLLMSTVAPVPELTSLSEVFIVFFAELSSCSMGYSWVKLIDKNIMADINLSLPLPNAPVPDPIRKATLQGCDKANLSHKFFNTSASAKYLEKEERTWRQCVSSFWGGGEISRKKNHTASPHSENTNHPLLLLG
jgi:hypothetical protein